MLLGQRRIKISIEEGHDTHEKNRQWYTGRRYAELSVLKFAYPYGLHVYGNEATVSKKESRSITHS